MYTFVPLIHSIDKFWGFYEYAYFNNMYILLCMAYRSWAFINSVLMEMSSIFPLPS